jgi:ATP/maltotriose-dependent transcriptional regulator MalT/DNA-binding SARP family transcriptional activator
MADSPHFPVAKITPPRIGVPLLVRARLHDAIREGVTKKLLLLSAEAGYGKTALLLAALPDIDLPVAWMTVDPSDTSPNLFSAALAASLQQRFPDMSTPVADLLTVGPSAAELHRMLRRMFEDLPPVVVVLDDFHAVDESPEVLALVDQLLMEMPPAVHVVIATRTWPRLTALPRLMVQSDALTIDKDRLRFTEQEAAAFFLESHGLAVDDELAGRLTTRTEGWAAALQLAALASRTHGTPALAGTPREVFDYLAATVVDALDPRLRDFLLRTSILAEFWPDLVRAVIPDADVTATVQELVRRNLFVYRLDDAGTRFRYHQLFAEFLQQRLAAQGAAEVAALHRRAARFLEDTNVPDEAVRHYLAAGAYADAERVMRPLHGDRLTARLAYTFRDLVTRLPSEVLDQYPWMARCGASSARFVGDYRLGLSLAQRSLAAAEGRDIDLWTFSIHGIGVMLSHLDRYDEAAALCERALESLDPNVEPRFRGGVISDLIDAYLELGRVGDALRLLPALEKIVVQGTQPGKSYGLAFFAGAVATAQMEYRRAIEHFTMSVRVGEERGSLTSQLWAHLGILRAHISRRNLAGARASLARCQELHELTGERASELLLTCLRGDVDLLAGDIDAAERAYQSVLSSLRETDSQEPRLWAQLGLARLARERGHLGEAGTLLEATSQLCARLKLGKLLPHIRFQQVSLFVQAGQLIEAEKLLAEIRVLMETRESAQGLARCDLIAARLQPNPEPLERVLNVDSDQMAELVPFAIEEASWTVPLLITALGEEGMPDRAAAFLTAVGPEAVNDLLSLLRDRTLQGQAIAILGSIGDPRARRPLAQLARGGGEIGQLAKAALARLREPEPVRLDIRLLGPFEVYRDAERISEAAWKTQKVKTLLKYLLLQRKRLVPQDEMIEILWPDADPESGAGNLKAAIKDLRQALEPLQEGPRSGFIQRPGQALQFTGDKHCRIDLDEYDALLAHADTSLRERRSAEAIRSLEQAVSLYRGDLVEDDRYEDWAALERERRRETQLEALSTLADLYAQRRDFRRALEAVQHVLTLDRLRERAYQQFMRYALARRDRVAALRAYETCVRLLREELGATPEAETTALFEQARAGVPV